MALENKIIISTRPVNEDDSFKDYLIDKGARVLDFPMIEICPAEIDENTKDVFNRIDYFNWIIFTSKNGVEYFFKTAEEFNVELKRIISSKIAVIGKKTAEEVTKRGLKAEFISSGNTSEEMLNELTAYITVKPEILLALGSLAGDTLEKGLKDFAKVTRINLYETKEPEGFSKDILEKIKGNEYDIIAFTSPSQVQNFIKITNYELRITNTKFACIGKTTAKEILKYGLKPLIVSSKSDELTFAKEIERYFINHN